jgi:hypothetical protein
MRWLALRIAFGFDLENVRRELIEKLSATTTKQPQSANN